jgi:molybdate transport system ATP-binding protein
MGGSGTEIPWGSAAWGYRPPLELDPQVKLCGVDKILDRGLKYMSTGEIRRTLLCRALLSGNKLLILSDPFAGLDAASRAILLDFFNSIANSSA